MKMSKNDLPVKVNVPGAVARQQEAFGDARDCQTMAGEHFSMAAGTDLTPLLKGLEGDLCQSPHWGYVIDGEIQVTYSDGEEETVNGGDLFYWPPGHTLRVNADAEMVLFSPEHAHVPVVEHVRRRASG